MSTILNIFTTGRAAYRSNFSIWFLYRYTAIFDTSFDTFCQKRKFVLHVIVKHIQPVYTNLLYFIVFTMHSLNEPPHDKTNKMAYTPSKVSDQPGHPPSLIRVFSVHIKKAWVLSYPLSAQRRLCSDWADAQADLSLRWAHSHFVGFVMRRLKCICACLLNLITSVCGID